MINKSLVKKRFSKSLTTYDDNAIIQKYMAEKLIEMLPSNEYLKVIEIGCATGVLTRKIKEKINFQELFVNDIVGESKIFIDELAPENIFIEGDIEEIEFNQKFDLIISNACLQWCNDFKKVITKLYGTLNDGGILAVSIFGNENLKEVLSIFDIENQVPDFSDFQVKTEIKKVYFDNPKDVLQHLKLTGANALKEYKLTKSTLKAFEKEYKAKYSQGEKVYLTYNPAYIVIKKNGTE